MQIAFHVIVALTVCSFLRSKASCTNKINDYRRLLPIDLNQLYDSLHKYLFTALAFMPKPCLIHYGREFE